eukprot:SAG11_NODE_1506_length_4781_cov_2.355831_8_plen_155_part_00
MFGGVLQAVLAAVGLGGLLLAYLVVPLPHERTLKAHWFERTVIALPSVLNLGAVFFSGVDVDAPETCSTYLLSEVSSLLPRCEAIFYGNRQIALGSFCAFCVLSQVPPRNDILRANPRFTLHIPRAAASADRYTSESMVRRTKSRMNLWCFLIS